MVYHSFIAPNTINENFNFKYMYVISLASVEYYFVPRSKSLLRQTLASANCLSSTPSEYSFPPRKTEVLAFLLSNW